MWTVTVHKSEIQLVLYILYQRTGLRLFAIMPVPNPSHTSGRGVRAEGRGDGMSQWVGTGSYFDSERC